MWWSVKAVDDMFSGGLFRFNEFMSFNCFRNIMAVIHFTDKDLPLLFTDGFHEV